MFASAVVILLSLGAFSYRALSASSESDRWVRHTHEVLGNLQELLFDVASVDASTRGFVLTGEETYLESFPAGVSSVKQRLSTLQNLTLDAAHSVVSEPGG